MTIDPSPLALLLRSAPLVAAPRAARTCCRSTARRCATTRRSPRRRRTGRRRRRRVPQARAGLLPNVVGDAAAPTSTTTTRRSRPIRRPDLSRNFYAVQRARVGVAAAVPLRRTRSRYDQAKQQVAQADYVLDARAAGPDRARRRRVFRRAARAVQHRAHREPEEGRVASSSRRRSATSRSASRRSPTPTRRRRSTTRSSRRRSRRSNDYDNKVTALRAIIGRYPKELKRSGPGFEPGAARARQRSSPGSTAR